MRESNNKRNHAHAQAMVISSAAGELTLGIGLGFVSVGLGILGLIIKSDCEELSCCYGLSLTSGLSAPVPSFSCS